MFRPLWAKVAAFVVMVMGAIAAYDPVSSQFELPKLGPALRWLTLHLPGWAIADIGLVVLFATLFDYVRVSLARNQAAEAVQPPARLEQQERPAGDISLVEAADMIFKSIGQNRRIYINREVADLIAHKDLTVWGRLGDLAITCLNDRDLSRVHVDVAAGTVALPGMMEAIRFRDIRFVRAEIEAVLPILELDAQAIA